MSTFFLLSLSRWSLAPLISSLGDEASATKEEIEG